jgi:hypothetical protein
MLWFAGCLVPQAYFLYAYLFEGYVPSTTLIIIMLISPFFCYLGIRQRRQQAARQLEEALAE